MDPTSMARSAARREPDIDTDGRVLRGERTRVVIVAAILDDVENVSFAINGSIARIFLDAEGVRYTTLRSDEVMSAADVVEQGRRATVLIECWNPVK